VVVLERLAEKPEGLSLAALTRETGFPKSTLYRILTTLQKQECVAYDEDRKRYHLGLKLWELGSAFLNQSDLYSAAVGTMKELAEACGESVFLGVLDDREVVYVRRRESPKSIMAVQKLGQRVPAYCTATGSAMIAFLSSEEVERILDERALQRFNPKTVTDPAKLKQRLEQIRETKVAVVDGEYNEELLCIASPVLDETHRPCAALTVVMLSSQASEAQVREIAPLVRRAAGRLSQELGYVATTVA